MGEETMRYQGTRLLLTVGSLYLIAIACFRPTSCLADETLIPYYITVQPIDVCSRRGLATFCAPINNMGQTVLDGPNTPIGFVDSAGINVTDAIWNQIGVRVTFQPTAQYISPIN